jgi:hypothetical protein
VSAYKTGVFDYKAIGDVYRSRGGAPFPITQDSPPKPIWYCTVEGCTRMSDPNTNEVRGTCSGYCVSF